MSVTDTPTGYCPPGLDDIVKGIEYMPGWLVYLAEEYDEDGSGGLQLCIVSNTPDSYHPERQIRVRHSFLVPTASYNERTWKAWIFERFVDVWRHETGEFLQFDGLREFAPHHGNGENPYLTWHVGDLLDAQVRAGDDKP